MKNVSVSVLAVVALLFATHADAAGPKRRTRNANRVGPYAGLLVTMTRYTSDQSGTESDLEDRFDGVPTQNLTIGTDTKDVGYSALFGYRFNRYMAAELALSQYGDLRSFARADVDLGTGFVPATINLKFHAGGPEFAAIGILPLNEKFEVFARAGVLFASAEREIVIRVNGNVSSFGSAKGDSTEFLIGVGAVWHINPMYSVRAIFHKLDGVGEKNRTGTEDLTNASLGLIVRF